MPAFTIPTRFMASAAMFINPGDSRPQIRGALYTGNGAGSALIATDGVAMVVCRWDEPFPLPAPITIPHELVEAGGKLKCTVAAAFDIDDAGLIRMSVPGGTRHAHAIDVPFVQWQNVIPGGVSGQPAGFLGDQVARLAKLAHLHRAALALHANGNDAATVFELVGLAVSGIVMPTSTRAPIAGPAATIDGMLGRAGDAP